MSDYNPLPMTASEAELMSDEREPIEDVVERVKATPFRGTSDEPWANLRLDALALVAEVERLWEIIKALNMPRKGLLERIAELAGRLHMLAHLNDSNHEIAYPDVDECTCGYERKP